VHDVKMFSVEDLWRGETAAETSLWDRLFV